MRHSKTDADGDALVFHANALPKGTSPSATGLLRWSNVSPVGDYRIRWVASDACGSSAPAELTIAVADTINLPATQSPNGGGVSMESDRVLLALAALALGRRLRRRQSSTQTGGRSEAPSGV